MSPTYAEDIKPDLLRCKLSFEFSGKSAPNRLLKSSIGERMASFSQSDIGSRGIPSVALVNLYKQWGKGNIGVIITGNIMIDGDHLVSAGDAVIPRDAPFSSLRFDRFSGMAREAKRHGSLVIAQLCHPGRQTPIYLQPFPIGASDLAVKGGDFGRDFGRPRQATTEDIDRIIQGFVHAAAYAERAGFDGIQLQAAHGHLLSQFLSSRTNHRKDRYGGNIQNRIRLISEIQERISERVAEDFIVGIKINTVEYQTAAFNPEEADFLRLELQRKRFDFVELSGGTYEDWTMGGSAASSQPGEAYYLKFARLTFPRMERTRTYLTGGLRTVSGIIHALEEVDGIGLARPLCQQPHLCSTILSADGESEFATSIDERDFHLTAAAALVQVQQIGRGMRPIDLCSARDVGRLHKAIIEQSRVRTDACTPLHIFEGDTSQGGT